MSKMPSLSEPLGGTFLVAQTVKRLSTMRETWVRSLCREDPLEKEMAIHSSAIAWKIPWTEEPDRLQSMGSQSQTRLSDFTFTFTLVIRTESTLKRPSSILSSPQFTEETG